MFTNQIVDADRPALPGQGNGAGTANPSGCPGNKGRSFHAFSSFSFNRIVGGSIAEKKEKRKKRLDKQKEFVYLIYVLFWTISSAG